MAKTVPWDQIVKGYEYEKGKFVVLKEDDFRRADIEATQSVEIIEFVKLEEIDPMFFDRPLLPLNRKKKAPKPTALLREALSRSGNDRHCQSRHQDAANISQPSNPSRMCWSWN